MAEEEDQEKAKATFPFASANGLKKTIELANTLHDRITSLALMNVELTKMLIASGHLDREKYLNILETVSKSLSESNSVKGAEFTELLKELLEKQTSEKQHADK